MEPYKENSSLFINMLFALNKLPAPVPPQCLYCKYRLSFLALATVYLNCSEEVRLVHLMVLTKTSG